MANSTILKLRRRQQSHRRSSERERLARVTTALEPETVEALEDEAQRQGLLSRSELIRNLVKAGLRQIQNDRMGEDADRSLHAVHAGRRGLTAEALQLAAEMAREYYATEPDAREWAEFTGDSASYDQG